MALPTSPVWAQRGFALVLVLWVLSLLTIMAGSFALSMRREASIVAEIKDNARAEALAKSGLAIAEAMLLLPDITQRWHADGGIYEIHSDDAFSGIGDMGGTVRIQLFAETGKIDLNKAEQKLLESLFLQSPLADDSKRQSRLVAAILDWRDQDDVVHDNGVEQKDYKSAGLSYQPTNKPFKTVDELRLVLGMDDVTFAWLAPLVTIYSGQAQVNAQQASKAVLAVLPDADKSLLDDYINSRRESVLRGQPIPPAPIPKVKNEPLGDNDAVTVICEALMEDGATAVISAVIKAGGGVDEPFQTLKWQTPITSEGSLFAEVNNELLIKDYAEPEFNH